jgi:hypothetical protein
MLGLKIFFISFVCFATLTKLVQIEGTFKPVPYCYTLIYSGLVSVAGMVIGILMFLFGGI